MSGTGAGRHARYDRGGFGDVRAWLDSGTGAANAAWFVLVGAGLSLLLAGIFALMQAEVVGQPDRTGVVQVVELTGREMNCGKSCSCPEARYIVLVDDGRPGVEFECSDYYEVGDELALRRHRGDSQEVYVDPLPEAWLPVAGAAAVMGYAVLLGLLGLGSMLWGWLVNAGQRRRGSPPRHWDRG